MPYGHYGYSCQSFQSVTAGVQFIAMPLQMWNRSLMSQQSVGVSLQDVIKWHLSLADYHLELAARVNIINNIHLFAKN